MAALVGTNAKARHTVPGEREYASNMSLGKKVDILTKCPAASIRSNTVRFYDTKVRLIIGFHTLRPLRFCYELVSA